MTLMALVRSYSPWSLPDRYVLFPDPYLVVETALRPGRVQGEYTGRGE